MWKPTLKKHMKGVSKQITNKIHNLIHYEFYKQVDERSYFELREKLRKQINNPMFGKTGEKHPMFGRKHSEETIRKISEAKRKNKESLDN